MKYLVNFLIIAVLLTQQLICHATAESLDGIVAYANKEVITQSELQRQFKIIKAQLSQSGVTLPSDQVLKEKVLNELISQSLELQKAKEIGIKIDDKTLDGALKSIAERNHMTFDQLKETVAQQGVPFSQYREDIRKQITVGKLQQQAVSGMISVTPEEVKHLMTHADQSQNLVYHVEHILVPVAAEDSAKQVATARQQATELFHKLQKSAEFDAGVMGEKVKKETESDDLGWRALNELPELFASKVKGMQVGEVVGPVQAPNGFHILKLVATKPKEGQAALTSQQAQQMVYEKKYNEAVESFVKQLRGASYIKVVGKL